MERLDESDPKDEAERSKMDNGRRRKAVRR
jgi:hypothetical protein